MLRLKEIVFFSLFVLVAQQVGAQEGDVLDREMALKKQSDAWIAAIISKDRVALETSMAESFVMIDMDGRLVDKRSFISNVTSPDLTIEPYVFEEFKIRIFGDTAIVNAKNRLRGTFKGQSFSRLYRYTDVFVQEAGRWRVVSVQATRINNESGAL